MLVVLGAGGGVVGGVAGGRCEGGAVNGSVAGGGEWCRHRNNKCEKTSPK